MQTTIDLGTGPITATDWPAPIPGLTMSPSGYLSGTPTVAGVYFRTIGATDSALHTAYVFNVGFVFTTPAAPSAAPPPTQRASITGYAPNSGPTAGGTVVNISGAFPDALSQVHINNVAISSSLWKQSATGITITMPPHTVGPVTIQIYNGQGPVLASQIFTYTDVAPTPTVTPSASATTSSAPSATPTPTVTPSAAPSVTPSATPTSTPTIAPEALKKASVYFALDSYALDAKAKGELKRIADEFNNSSATIVELFGYTDSQGGVDNLKLSQQRAQSVANYLKPLLTDQSVVIAWKGARNPVANGNTEAAYAKNRRVEIWTK